MNELRVFENAEFGEVQTITKDGKKEYFVNGVKIDRFKLLAMACEEESEENA